MSRPADIRKWDGQWAWVHNLYSMTSVFVNIAANKDKMGQHWLDGLWYFEDFKFMIYEVKGEVCYWKNLGAFDYPDLGIDSVQGTWEYGSFGETSAEVKKTTGADTYTVEIKLYGGKITRRGVVSEDGKSIYGPGIFGGNVEGKWIDQDGLKALQANREDIHYLSCPYTKQPENQGKLLWLSGPPGAGKSTTAQLLAKDHGQVYYEADGFLNMINPYIPLDVPEPSLAQFHQKSVTGRPRKTMETLLRGLLEFPKFAEGQEFDLDVVNAWYTEMAKDILREKNKIGGSWAVAQAVPKQSMRDIIRKVLGDQCVFVILSLSAETNAKRINTRHAYMDEASKESLQEWMNNMYQLYELAGADEENAVNVEIGTDMDKYQVAQAILQKVQKYF